MIKKAISIGYSTIFLIFFINTIITTNFDIKNCCLGLLFILMTFVIPEILIKFRTKADIIRIISFGIFAVLQLCFFAIVAIPTGWDSGYVVEYAFKGLNGPVPYFARWKNNIFIASIADIWVSVIKIFLPNRNELSILVLLNVIVVDLAMVVAYIYIRKLFDAKTSDRFMISAICCIGMNPWLEVYYTDTIGALFPITFICLMMLKTMFKAEWVKYVCTFFAFYVGVVGISIKPTVVIIMIAYIIGLIIYEKVSINKKTIIYVMVVLFATLSANMTVNIIDYKLNTYIDNNYPEINTTDIYYFIDTGLTSFGKGYWNSESFNWHEEHMYEPDYAEQSVNRIIGKIKEYRLQGMVEHLWGKLKVMGNDGTFFFGGEGSFYMEELAEQDTLKGKLQNYIYTESNFYKQWVRPWFDTVWIIICVQNVLSILYVSGGKEEEKHIFTCKLAIGGLVLFLLLFENRSRYIILYLPIIISVAQSGIIAFREKIKK